MFVCCINATDVVDVNHTTAVSVHLGKGTHDDSFTIGIHGATDGSKELVILNQATAVVVDESKELLDFTL